MIYKLPLINQSDVYDSDCNVLRSETCCGLMSLSLNTLRSLLYIHTNITSHPVTIEWINHFWNIQNRKEKNIFELYFKQNTREDDPVIMPHNTQLPHWYTFYDKIDYEPLKVLIAKYFDPDDKVKLQKKSFLEKYSINPKNTIGVLCRMTDKIFVVPSTPLSAYTTDIDKLSDANRILVQTDQQQMFDLFKGYYKDRCFKIEEIPTTTALTVMHHTSTKLIRDLSNYELGIRFLAVLSILSECKYVVYNTCSPAYWINLLRGGVDGTCQYIPKIESVSHLDKPHC